MAELNIGGLKIELTMDPKDVVAGGAKAGEALKGVEKSTMAMAKRFEWASAVIKGTIIGAIAGLGITISKTLQHQAGLHQLAQALGTTVEELSRLEYAAGTTGVKTEQLGAAITTLNKNLDMAAGSGAGPAAQALKALGLSATDASGKLLELPDALGMIADKFQGYQDGAGKAAIAAALFGDAGTKLIPLLNQGSEGIDALKKRADELGLTLGGEAAARANAFNQAMSAMGQVSQMTVGTILQRMLPTLQGMAEHMTGTANQTSTLTMAADILNVTLKGLISAGSAVVTMLELMGGMLMTTGKALLSLASGEFSQAVSIMKAGAAELNATVKASQEFQQKLWDETLASNIRASEEIPKNTTPIISSIDTMTGSMEGFAMSAQHALNTILESPTETAAAKIKAIEDAARSGAIGFYEMEDAIRSVNATAADQMDQLLSLTSQTLGAIFSESKGVAIAQALINTYQGITKALASLPPPASYAAAALVAAQGFAQVASIRSTQKNGSGSGRGAIRGGGGGGGGGNGGSTSNNNNQSSAAPSQTLFLQGVRPDALYSGEAVRGLAEALIAYQRDGGKIVLGAT